MGKVIQWSRQGPGSMVEDHPHSQILSASRGGVFVGQRRMSSVISQSSDDCCWPELDHCCSVPADKHKLERFLRLDAALVVTVYAPITFPPASVLLFKQRSNGEWINAGEVVSGKQTVPIPCLQVHLSRKHDLKKLSPSCCSRC